MLNVRVVKELRNKDAPEIVERLNESIASLERILNPQSGQPEDFTLDIVHLLAKACDAPSSDRLINVLACMKNSLFLKENIGFSLEVAQTSKAAKPDKKLFGDLITLFSTFLQRLPGSFADVPIEVLERVLKQLDSFEGKEEALIRVEKLNEERSTAIRMARESKQQMKRRTDCQGKPPNDFRELSVCPSSSEVTANAEKPFLRKNITKGRYDDVEHYLDVQFRLLREDFLSPLRDGIAEVVGKVPRKECRERIKLYKKVRILGREHTKKGITFKVQFDASPFTTTRWESSKRLIYGSFLCLSKDNFQSMIFATVANRDPQELKKGQFDIQFLEDQDVEGIERQHAEYVMAESRAYYESCRHVLLGLKQMDEDKLPFVKYLVECSPDVDPPQYLARGDEEVHVRYDLRCIMQNDEGRKKVPILLPEAWPSTEDVRLDQSQFEAFKTSLTKEFSIIQGPPGTGKTHVGAEIVQCLIKNRQVWDPQFQSPMLMVCYTNHALDQFLEKLIPFLPDGIIRVGGRSKSERLKFLNLRFSVGRKSERQKQLEKDLQKTVQRIKWAKTRLRTLGHCIRPFTQLEYSMDERHVDQFFHLVQETNAADICKAFEIWLCNKEKEYSQANARANETKDGSTVNGRPMAGPNGEVVKVKGSNANEAKAETRSENHGEISANGHDAPICRERKLPGREKTGDEHETRTSASCESWTGGMSNRPGQAECTVPLDGGNESRQSECQSENSSNHREIGVEHGNLDGDREQLQGQCPQTSEEAIEIEFESDLLQGQRYLTGEEDDLKPLEAIVTEADEDNPGCAGYDSDVSDSSTADQNSDMDPLENDNACPPRNENMHIAPVSEENVAVVEGPSSQSGDEPPRDTSPDGTGSVATDTVNADAASGDIWSGTTGKECKQTAAFKRRPKVAVTSEDLRKVRAQLQNETAMAKGDASNVCDICALSAKKRRKLYLFWLGRYREYCVREIERGEKVYKQHCKSLEDTKSDEEEIALSGATVIGMTTTGAARYRDILRRIKPKIVVIEEAAEVLEAHIITSLTEDTQHVIMIGDHQQLRPKATKHDLAQRYNLEISLFERMVLNRMDCKVLNTQHRMRPEIAELTKRIYANKINDHETVLELDNVKGVKENLFFLDHRCPETRVEGLESYANDHEAKVAVALCRYLLQQGYPPSRITVLTTYIAQLLALQRLMPKRIFDGVRVSAVDNFQGEENDIIILSLVRSENDRPKGQTASKDTIGFLAEPNRICVALSRARQGFYCIGNFDRLSKKSDLWREICDDMRSKQKLGDALILECERHGKVRDAKTAKDFDMFPSGGCGEVCFVRLSCGHACDKLCHPINAKPEEHKCAKMCPNKCPNQHPCRSKCDSCHHSKRCPDCPVKVVKVLPKCGHEQETECWIESDQILCQKSCENKLPCGHDCSLICGYPCEMEPCKVPVPQSLPCSHERIIPCCLQDHECIDPCKKLLPCKHPCPLKCAADCTAKCQFKVMTGLPCGHTKEVRCQNKQNPGACTEKCMKLLDCEHHCPGLCRDDCTAFKCPVLITKELPCGHSQVAPCGDHENVTCTAKCEKVCSRNHSCGRKCHAGSECSPCKKRISFEISTCGHVAKVPCHTDLESVVCREPCKETLITCGHKCQGKCGSPCETRACTKMVNRTLKCSHKVKLPCNKDPEKHPCRRMVNKTLKCAHQVQLPCTEDPQKHQCAKMVKKNLPCKHQVVVKCHLKETDIPCETLVPSNLPCHRHGGMIKCRDAGIASRNVLAAKYPCMSAVLKTLPCGHMKKMRCCDSPATANCTGRCPTKLECGHPCTGECSDCRIRGYHKECKFPCGRKLICCHMCQATCGVPCSPCPKLCTRRCSHGSYRARCSVTSEPCPIPCEWACPHYKCTKLCKEMCNRPPCDKPCQRQLQCGHLCIGLCGEDCPSLCRICDTSELSKIHPDYQMQSTRFIQLIDCDHIIEVGRMDDWMGQPKNEVHLGQCPICQTPIRWCFRYGNVIRQSARDVQRVFREARNDASQIQVDIKGLKKEMRHFPNPIHFPGAHACNTPIAPADLASLNCFKNNLKIVQQISKTLHTLKAVDAILKQDLGSPQMREGARIVETSRNALKAIEKSLDKPIFNFGMLSQQHKNVVTFELGIHLIECWCKVVTEGVTLSPSNLTDLDEQKRRLAVYVAGRPDALDHRELQKVVKDVRDELGMASLPTPQPIDLMNFAGFSSSSWLRCEKGHVYALRRITRDGERIEELRQCRRCEEIGESKKSCCDNAAAVNKLANITKAVYQTVQMSRRKATGRYRRPRHR